MPVSAMLAFLLVCAWAWLQSVPLSSLPFDLTGLAHPGWARLERIGLDGAPLIGLNAIDTRDALMRLLTCGAAFWLASRLAIDRERAKFMAFALIAIASFYALYGLANHLLGLAWILPGVPRPSMARLQSTFVNANNFATFANMALFTALAFVTAPLFARDSAPGSWLKQAASGLASPKGTFLGAAIVILAFASLLTGSRGGLLSLALTLAFLSFLIALAARIPLFWRIAVPSVLVVLFSGVMLVSGDYSLSRIGRAAGLGDARLAMYDTTLQMIADRPWLGHGYGNFEAAFMAYRDERLSAVVDKAHNTYLEHAAELGLPATLLLYAAIAILLVRIQHGFFTRRRDRAFTLAAWLAAMVAGLHALVDFSLQIPAVGYTFTVLLGIGIAQSTSSHVHVELEPKESHAR
ncbi:MAG: O-antigen ligase family protein [Geminicoccaceae bacterium]